MTTLTDERIFSDSLLGPPSGQSLVKSKQGLVFLSRIITGAQTAAQATGDHILFVTPVLQVGNNITVDTASPYTTVLNTPSAGRITLQPGTYYIRASVLEIGTSLADGIIEFALRNADTGAYFNNTGSFLAGIDRTLLHDSAIVTVTGAPMRIEFTAVFALGLIGYGKALLEIDQLA